MKDDPSFRERVRGFLDFADVHLLRGNVDAAREALDDAERLLLQVPDEEFVEW